MDFAQQDQRQRSGQSASAVQDREDDQQLDEMPSSPRMRRSGRSEAGRKGGEATRAKMGADFYRRIGRKGGQARRQRP